jgi:predicted aldo/keto reductase-like oxidoreductase
MRMLEQTEASDIFDTVLMPVNLLDASYYSFIENVMPKALDRNMGILSIKSLADGRFFSKKEEANWTSDDPVIPNYVSIKEAMHFVWSLPVSVLIAGNENATYMREKIALARSFSKLSEDEKQNLIDKVKLLAESGGIEYYKQKES